VSGARAGSSAARPRFFATPAAFGAWLRAHHATERELWVGFHKRATGKPSLTWPESVDEALCVGWIDGLRKSVDATSYAIRFTPRKPASRWSAVNVRRMRDLLAAGRVLPAGEAAFDRAGRGQTSAYSYEGREDAQLEPAMEAEMRQYPAAWEHFTTRAPGYRRTAAYWVVSAKRPETRARRLRALIEACAAGRPIGLLQPAAKGARNAGAAPARTRAAKPAKRAGASQQPKPSRRRPGS
jgi:uncharacterized protein YdeI (YjbR/CyaY-like superfamily)